MTGRSLCPFGARPIVRHKLAVFVSGSVSFGSYPPKMDDLCQLW